MANKTVNHRERKREIRAISLRLFARHGFDDVNFGMIAEACGISRTLLYTYFKDKRQIFNEAIDGATDAVGVRAGILKAIVSTLDHCVHVVAKPACHFSFGESQLRPAVSDCGSVSFALASLCRSAGYAPGTAW